MVVPGSEAESLKPIWTIETMSTKDQLVKELQKQLKEAIEAAVGAAMVSHFEKDIVGAVEAERKHTDLVKQPCKEQHSIYQERE